MSAKQWTFSPKETCLMPLLCIGLASCFHAPPLPIEEGWVVQQVSGRYREFFPRPASLAAQTADSTVEAPDEAGLLRPRLGLPEIVQTGTTFDIELLERGSNSPRLPWVALLQHEATDAAATDCLRGVAVVGCHPLRIELLFRTAALGGRNETSFVAHYLAHLDSALFPPPGGYDLLMRGEADSVQAAWNPSSSAVVTRAPHAVWLRHDDPSKLLRVRVAHLSDLHVGKGGRLKSEEILARLRQIVENVNRLAPDLVIVTGDIVNSGQQPQLWPVAQKLLGNVAAPVLVVLGNHDIEFMQRGMRPVRRYGAGWANFARAFHPFLHFSLSLGGYDFVGFDSGPAERSPRILTRGLHPASVALLRDDIMRAQQRGRRGVVLFSHAPSRASTFTHIAPRSAGFFGRMRYGNADFEGVLMEAAARGQRVLHLSGHTHWSDVFELDPPTRQFQRWPSDALSPCPRPLRSPVALITTQAAGHSGLFSKANARGYGFALLTLGGEHPELAVFRYGTTKAAFASCEDNRGARLADTSIGGKLL